MHLPARCVLIFALAMPQVPPPASLPPPAPQGPTISGRVVDGLGRPVAGVDVKAYRGRDLPMAVFPTGPDGRYAGKLAPGDSSFLAFEKPGYGGFIGEPGPGDDVMMKQRVDYEDIGRLVDEEGGPLDRGIRELLASEDWASGDVRALGFAFKHQAGFRPALRRLVDDPHVGDAALDWLDLLGDPADFDLFPEGRTCLPKAEVKEADLVEAIRATARQRNFFSSNPEPMIDLTAVGLSKSLDGAFVSCGINCAAFTGILWQFVFHKSGKAWELRSAKRVGRG